MTYKLYDLSFKFGRDTPTYMMDLSEYNPPMLATYTAFKGTPRRNDPGHVGLYYDTMLAFFSHTGTHMDAPAHMDEEGWTLDEIPLDRLVGDGVVVGIPKEEEGVITAEDLENATPKIQKGDIVAINTGWHKNFVGPITDWDKAVYYSSKYPGLGKSGAEWLVKRGIKTLLVEGLSVDGIPTTSKGDGTWICHKILFAANIPVVEVLGGELDKVTGKRCIICCAPVKYEKGDAFPVRVIAMVEE